MAFKQRKFRAKAQDEEAEEDDGAGPAIRPPQPIAKPGAAAAAAKASSRASASSSGSKAVGSKLSLLSFDEEGDDPGFVSKKDSKKDKQRSKLARAPLPDLPPPEPASQTLRSTAGEGKVHGVLHWAPVGIHLRVGPGAGPQGALDQQGGMWTRRTGTQRWCTGVTSCFP